jgi:hypothetical protein
VESQRGVGATFRVVLPQAELVEDDDDDLDEPVGDPAEETSHS